ncbi:uncharacterized protein LOC127279646 [Leptopilina boulardi]|uniref:uncharacterized protein LOC127279646 n=1 Tax=Leptopilina boulardi TaxID=63433 RepID=UPI0021F5B8CD|nr:uncharacterized protein LOC127279646 [Leptopilina boulardi]
MKILIGLCTYIAIICDFIAIDGKTLKPENPIYLKECPNNLQLFVADEDRTEKFCDCEDKLLYHQEHNSCYDAYRKGPCPIGYYFIVPPGEIVAKCEQNPCEIDGLVPYDGQCHTLWKIGYPCSDNSSYLGINENFQIECDDLKYAKTINGGKSLKFCPANAYLPSIYHRPAKFICECEEPYIFSPTNFSCQEAYRQGTCPQGSYLTLAPGERHPKCEVNPCQYDGLVPFEGGCHRIYKYGTPCPSYSYKLTVTAKSFKPKCVKFNYPSPLLIGGIITAPVKACTAGSKRVILLGCKRVFS